MKPKKIVCPVDFSPASENAAEYAASLAKKLNLPLELMNVQLVLSLDPVQENNSSFEFLNPASDHLTEQCAALAEKYGISCKHSIDITQSSLGKTIAEDIPEDNLLLLGTDGASNLFQAIFGSNSYQVARRAKCPVMIIPSGVSYSSVQRIVYAWDYEPANELTLSQVLTYAGADHPHVTFLHISTESTPISDEISRAIRDTIQAAPEAGADVSFARVYTGSSEEFPTRIDEYVTDADFDLLVINRFDRGVFGNAFHGSILKRLSEIVKYPLLIIPVKK
jgi:nucleotide-binding universal stress UspA family protein